MAISPLEQLGAIGRTHDYSIMKQQEDGKEMGNQTLIHMQVEKNANEKLNQVRQADHSEMNQKKFDAKDKGDNQYFGDGGKKRKNREEKPSDGKVVVKNGGSFDMKV